MPEHGTIAAISTPLAPGAIGMIRLSGPDAIAIADRLFLPAGPHPLRELPGYRGAFGHVRDGEGTIDEAVVFVYRAPKSYTGEDVVEICCHGGPFLLQRTLRACFAQGAAPAEPGEFTKRAVLHGKMDLTQAEAVMELISAQGRESHRLALAAKEGATFQRIQQVTQELVAIAGHLAAWTDYPEEDMEELSPQTLLPRVQEVRRALQEILRAYDNGQIYRQGVTTAIVGRPNVGKSTLMNLFSGRERSIVTDIPGTTRDVVEESVRLGDLVLHLADTAGIRETADLVEAMGVDRALERMESCQLVLALFDGSQPLGPEDERLLDRLQGRPCVAVINKSDLPSQADEGKISQKIPNMVAISALNQEGMGELEAAIRRVLEVEQVDPQAAVLVNERQRACVQRGELALAQGEEALAAGMTLDAVGVCLDEALEPLLELLGQRATDAVVQEVFSHFCVGK